MLAQLLHCCGRWLLLVSQFDMSHLERVSFDHSSISSMAHQHHLYSADALLEAFRTHYQRFDNSLREALLGSSDANVLARLGDDFDEYASMVEEVS